MQYRKIIIDCDPGHDDAVAILMAARHPKFDLLGITTVNGNDTLEKVTRNALNVCQHLGIDVPVCRGMSVPMVRNSAYQESYVHGESGLDGPVFEPLTLRRPVHRELPATFLAFRSDQTMPPGYWHPGMSSRLNGATVTEIDGDHEVPLTAPEQLADALHHAAITAG